MSSLEAIIQRISHHLAQTRVSQLDFARVAKVSAPYLNQLLKGKNKNPGLVQLQGVAEAMGISVGELLGAGDHDVTECYRRIGNRLRQAEEASEKDFAHRLLTLNPAERAEVLRILGVAVAPKKTSG